MLVYIHHDSSVLSNVFCRYVDTLTYCMNHCDLILVPHGGREPTCGRGMRLELSSCSVWSLLASCCVVTLSSATSLQTTSLGPGTSHFQSTELSEWTANDFLQLELSLSSLTSLLPTSFTLSFILPPSLPPSLPLMHRLLEMVEECFGPTAKSSVGNIQADHLPAILIIFKVKGAADIRQIIQGIHNLTEYLH